jgi:hypothetical protein
MTLPADFHAQPHSAAGFAYPSASPPRPLSAPRVLVQSAGAPSRGFPNSNVPSPIIVRGVFDADERVELHSLCLSTVHSWICDHCRQQIPCGQIARENSAPPPVPSTATIVPLASNPHMSMPRASYPDVYPNHIWQCQGCGHHRKLCEHCARIVHHFSYDYHEADHWLEGVLTEHTFSIDNNLLFRWPALCEGDR